MTTTTPPFTIGQILTVEIEAKRGLQPDFFKAECFKNDRLSKVFVFQPDDPPHEWWKQVSTGDKLKVEITCRSTSNGISVNTKALPFDAQPVALQRAIRKRERGLIGKLTRVDASLKEEEHADLKYALELEKQRKGRSLLLEEVTRELIVQGLVPYRVARLLSEQLKSVEES